MLVYLNFGASDEKNSLFVWWANAALLLDPVAIQAVGATSTSNFGGFYTTDKTIDQSDLSGSYTSGVTSTSVIDGFTLLNNGNGWHGGSGDTVGSIIFDLGGQYTLDRVYLFWMNVGRTNNIADFSIDVASNSNFINSIVVANFGTPAAAQNRIDFQSLATGGYVRLNWTSLQGSYPGLNEFIAGGVVANSVPEPASLALFGLGLAGLGFSRKKKAA